MPLEDVAGVTREALSRAKPRAAKAGEQYYEIEDASGARIWVRGVELLHRPVPAKVTAIAWRV